jgi:hypothetical protein
VAGGSRRLHNEELRNLYNSANVIREMESRRMRWVGHVEPVRDMKNIYSILSQNLNGTDHWEELRIDGMIILEWMLIYVGKAWIRFIWLVAHCCKHDNETSDSIKDTQFLD